LPDFYTIYAMTIQTRAGLSGCDAM